MARGRSAMTTMIDPNRTLEQAAAAAQRLAKEARRLDRQQPCHCPSAEAMPHIEAVLTVKPSA